ncbi:MAG: CTP synthase (glutamine hydrolyzing) [Candidatus Woesearchaeota archaeon]|nr:CTP synthase (glutamine hydrolyzing) [Candidatus Woesearchaeota archaeon]
MFLVVLTNKTKWIIVTGGVLSGLGKGIVTASIGRLLNSTYRVIPVKCDGYLNVDPGTMNPIEHGEVFVLDDGGEVDMDFGHYERFLNINCKFKWNLTSGKVFKAVIDRERRGDYLGKTVQMIPHVTDEIKNRLFEIANEEKADIMLIEIGGTVGDIENMLFIEAARQLKSMVGRENILYVHLAFVPVVGGVEEQKSKPTQQSVSMLEQRGIQPDIVIGRSEDYLQDKIKEKIALFSNVRKEEVISDPKVETTYELPIIFEKEGLLKVLKEKLALRNINDLVEWKKLVANIKNPKNKVKIAICGKYTALMDSYASIIEALMHAGAHLNAKVELKWIETTEIENGKVKVEDALKDVNGVIVPGGFGARGTEGKIKVIQYARENDIPFLGLCYGLQLAVIEFARNVCGLKDAGTSENDEKTNNPVIDILPEQKNVKEKGATMRLGACKAVLKKGSIVQKLYNSDEASERHRHRYEVNPDYHKILEEKGLMFSGMSPNGRLVEFIELSKHKFFIATQAHPELKSRLEDPAPLFYGFVKAAIK